MTRPATRASGGAWGLTRSGAGPPQAESAPSGGSDPRKRRSVGVLNSAPGRSQAEFAPPWGAATRVAAERGGYIYSVTVMLTSSLSPVMLSVSTARAK